MAKQSRRIKSVAVAARILDALARSRESLSLTQLSQIAKISPSRAHAYVSGMIAAKLVEQTGSYGRYALGSLARTVGTAAIVRHDPIAVLDHAATALHNETQLTVALAVWHSTGPTIVRWIRGHYSLPIQISVGSTVPVTTTAIGHIFLAYLPEKITAPLASKELAALLNSSFGSPQGPLNVAEIAERTREAGCSFISGTLLPDMCAIAAPIFDEEGRINAALSLIGRNRFAYAGGEKRMRRAILRVTQEASQNMSGIQRGQI